MSDKMREASDAPRPTTVLDPLRPAVVVRRRVYDARLFAKGAHTQRSFTTSTRPPSPVDEAGAASTGAGAPIARGGGPSTGIASADEEDEQGPPSSIDVARALASLRSDELQQVEDLVRADDELVRAPSTSGKEATPPGRTLTLGETIPLVDLAERVGIPAQELAATLVARGFYAITAKTVLPRATARIIAEMFGWRVEGTPSETEEAAPAKSGTRSRVAARRKAGVKTKAARPKSKVKAKSNAQNVKRVKRRVVRSSERV